jgi:hypothetical protein
MTEQTLHAVEETGHVVAKAGQVAEETAQVARVVSDELDWATVRESLAVAAIAAARFVQWWLCGRGLHSWEAWEYDDGTVLEECSCCGGERRL